MCRQGTLPPEEWMFTRLDELQAERDKYCEFMKKSLDLLTKYDSNNKELRKQLEELFAERNKYCTAIEKALEALMKKNIVHESSVDSIVNVYNILCNAIKPEE